MEVYLQKQMGIQASQPLRHFDWKMKRELLFATLYNPPFGDPREVEFLISKAVYDFVSTSFFQNEILDYLNQEFRGAYGEFTLESTFSAEGDDDSSAEENDDEYTLFRTFTFTPSRRRRFRRVKISIQAQPGHAMTHYGMSISSRDVALLTQVRNFIQIDVFPAAREFYENLITERNALVALASAGKDEGTRRGEALEQFARHYYPSSIRSVVGNPKEPIQDESMRSLARQYSEELTHPQVGERLFADK